MYVRFTYESSNTDKNRQKTHHKRELEYLQLWQFTQSDICFTLR